MKTLSLFLILLSLLFCLEPNSKKDTNLIKISYSTDPSSIDPIETTDLVSEKLVKLLHSSLFEMDEKGKITGKLVTSYNWNSQTRTLNLNLISGLNAEEVKTSLLRLLQTKGPRKEAYKDLQILESNSKSKISIRISNELSYNKLLILLSLPASFISSDTGPYLLKSWKRGNKLSLEFNPRYKKLFPKIEYKNYLPERLDILIIPQSTSGIFLFTKGQLHSLKLSDFLLNHPVAKQNKILSKKGRSVQYVAINNSKPCFDRNFREAMNLAIPREKIISYILDNQAELTFASIPISKFDDEFIKQNKMKFLPRTDLKLAKEKLTQSKCFPEILKQELDFRMRADDENQSKGKAVLESLRSLGLNIKLNSMEKSSLYKENGLGLGDFTFLTWYADYDSVNAFLYPLFDSDRMGNAGNRAFYKNDKLDESIQNENILKSIEILVKEKPWIYLWSIQENYLLAPSILRYRGIAEYL
jgi:peptide/nickel transport system substrate-binding protein